MRTATAIAAVVLALLLCVSAVADIPETISYQGVLRDDTGTVVPDGDYFVTFRLYDVETGGTQLWEEGSMMSVEDGIVNAHLGSVVTLTTLDFLVPYWLGISIDDEDELVPRTSFETVPYAVHASFADGIAGGANWEASGDDLYRNYGNVGIGLPPEGARLHVIAGDMIAGDFDNGSTAFPTLRARNAGGTGGAFYSCVEPFALPDPPAAVYGHGACGARGGHFYSSSGDALYANTTGVTTALVAEASGTGYAAQFFGNAGIQVQYRADVGSFRMFGGSSPGYVLTSDADGIGTWQEPAGGDDGDWIANGSNLIAGNTGYVGIGATAPASKLEVEMDETNVRAFTARHVGGAAQVVDISRTSVPSSGNDILQLAAPLTSPPDFQFIECEAGGSLRLQVMGDGDIVSVGGATFGDDVTIDNAALLISGTTGQAAYLTTNNTSAGPVLAVEAVDAGGMHDGAAVLGTYVQSTDYGIGGHFTGGWRGVAGYATSSGGTMPHYGVYGTASGTTGSIYAVYGYAVGGAYPYGGYFVGNGYFSGTLTAPVKSLKIDHPLDPANKYLLHSSVESDEMTNIYTGNVTLDASGKAQVQLPDWFEALNRDFRYQLTAIGAPGPSLYIAQKINGNSFTIAGGDPGMEVSWLVTGVRDDPVAREHRVVVEQDKPANEIGKYMHPELYGMPVTAGVDYEVGHREPAEATVIEPEPRPPFDPTDGE